MNKFDFKGKTAGVTGGAQGFGLDIAKRFLDGGAKVFIWDIDEKLLKSVFDEIKNPNLNYNLVDVSKYDEVQKIVLKILVIFIIYFQLAVYRRKIKNLLSKLSRLEKTAKRFSILIS